MRQIIVGSTIAMLTAVAALTGCRAPDTPPAGGTVAAEPDSAAADVTDSARVLVIGTSITAGYGVGEEEAYPSVLQQMVDSAGLPFSVVNAGISGETSAGGLRRIEWSLQQPVDVLILELGANDALRGLPVHDMRANLDSILARARAAQPGIDIVILGMEAPPNLGDAYTSEFRDTFRDLAAKYAAGLVPFVLDSVVAEPSLNIDDGIHPNAAGHRVIARNVWRTLAPILGGRVTPTASRAPQPPSSDES